MLALMMKVGDRVYGLDCRVIKEVLPFIPLQPGVQDRAATLNYHGRDIRAIDLAERFLGRAATQRLTTRIVVVGTAEGRRRDEVGLVAESVTETRRLKDYEREPESDPQDVIPSASWRGPTGERVAIIDVAALLESM